MKSHFYTFVYHAGFALLLAILSSAWTPVHAIEPGTACRVRLWFDVNFSNPANLNATGGNPPPGSKIIGIDTVAEPIFDTSTNEPDLDVYQMRVDDMNFFNNDWHGFSEDVSSISFMRIENNQWVSGCEGWTAILYDEKNFQGNAVPITGSQSRLSNIDWNDRAKSFKLIGPANRSMSSPPVGCTVELYEHDISVGDTWGASSHFTPHNYSAPHGAGKISSIRFGGECGISNVRLFDGMYNGNSITFTNADGPVFDLTEFGWGDRAMSWTANFNVAPDPSPQGCILRLFSGGEYTGQTWAIAESQTTGTISGRQGTNEISSLAFEGNCGDSEVIFYDASGTRAYVRVADGVQHPLWLSDWNNRAVSLTANFVSGPATPTDPRLPVPTYVPCEVQLYEGIYSGSHWGANTDQATNNKFESNLGAGNISSVEFKGAWCHDTFLELYDVDPTEDSKALPYIVKVADGVQHNLAALSFDNKTQFWRVNFSDAPPKPSEVPDVVNMMYTDAEDLLRRMFYFPVADPDYIVTHAESRDPDGKVLWTSDPSKYPLPAGTPLPPGSAVHYTKYRHPQGPPPPPPPPPPGSSDIATFAPLPGNGRAIDMGTKAGPIWVVGTSGTPFRNFMNTWQVKPGVEATRMTQSYNQTWVIDHAGYVYRTPYSAWEDMSSGAIPAQDIGWGWGALWIAGSNPPYDIQRRLVSQIGTNWETPISVPGGAKYIDADLHGNPWVVNQSGQIYRYLIGGWQALPGSATDIGCGGSGDVWIAGTNPVSGGYEIFRWNEDIFNWELVPNIGGVVVSVSGNKPYVIADDGVIYEGTVNVASPPKPPKSHPPVPNVAGMTTANAISTIQSAGYIAMLSNSVNTSDQNLFDTVESTTPAGGVPLAPGETVSYTDYQAVTYQLQGTSPMTLYAGDLFADPGLHIKQHPSETHLATLTGDISALNTSLPGTYTVPYHDNGPSGTPVLVAERVVIVQLQVVPNVVGMTTAAAISAIQSAGYIPVQSGSVNTADTNLFDTIESTTPVGNAPLAIGSIVSYVDYQALTYQLQGNSPMILKVGQTVFDPGVVILHPSGTQLATLNGDFAEVDTSLPGTYTVPYYDNDDDPSGNPALVAERVVIVQSQGYWKQVPEGDDTQDIDIAANNAMWKVTLDGSIFEWNATQNEWNSVIGEAKRIAVSPGGIPWVLSLRGGVYRWNGEGWIQMPGDGFIDLAMGGSGDGEVWALGGSEGATGYSIYRWNADTNGWDSVNGLGVKIDVGPDGLAWLCANDGTVWRWDTAAGGWLEVPGPGFVVDITRGADGSAWCLAGDGTGDNYPYKMNFDTWVWEPMDGGGIVITAAGDGLAWVVKADGTLWRADTQP